MTGTQLSALIRFYTKTDSNTFTDADMLPLVNVVKDEICPKIAARNQNYFIIPQTQDIVASSVTAREYALPDDLMNDILTVEVALDSSNPTVYVAALPYTGGFPKLSRIMNGITESNITQNFSNQGPFYILTRRGIFILSGTISGTVTNGLKIRSRQYPADLANLTGSADLGTDATTTSFGVPRLFHELWGRRTSIIWKSQRPQPIPLSALETQYPTDLQTALDEIIHDDQQAQIVGEVPTQDGMDQLGANI